VRHKEPNPFGPYDMLGNVYEWCRDMKETYTHNASTNPEPEAEVGREYVLRGGVWYSIGKYMRAANRIADLPGHGKDGVSIGLRLVRDAETDKSKMEGPR